MSSRATLAMVRIRLGDEPSTGLVALVLLGFVNVLRPAAGAQTDWIAVATVGGGVAIATAATFRRSAVARTTELRLFAAPLYGKEVARAQALVPCLTALVPAAVLLLVYGPGAPLTPGAVAGLALALIAATLIALAGTLRTGRDRTIYVAAALGAGWGLGMLPLAFGKPGLLVAVLTGAAVIYAALRAFGETLARFDPID